MTTEPVDPPAEEQPVRRPAREPIPERYWILLVFAVVWLVLGLLGAATVINLVRSAR